MNKHSDEGDANLDGTATEDRVGAAAQQAQPEGPGDTEVVEASEPVHEFFGLTYANYLVLHRTLLQSMPPEWQRQFVRLVEELEAAFRHIDRAPRYQVASIGDDGRFVVDPVPHYRRGRARVQPVTK